MNSLITQVDQLQNVAQFIASKLEGQILKGEIPPGERLIQTEIAAKFNVSRLPVRDAFRILEKKELVVTLPRKGMVVRPFSLKEVEDLFELRIVLESHAFKASAPKLHAGDLTEIAAIIHQQATADGTDHLLLLDLDEKFHFNLLSRCGNQEILQLIETTWRRIRVIRAVAREVSNWRSESVKSHRKIVGALKRKNVVEGLKQLQQSMIRGKEEIVQRLQLRESGTVGKI